MLLLRLPLVLLLRLPLLLLLLLSLLRPAVALGCRAGERGGRVAADEVVAQCLQVWEQGCQALLQYRGVRDVVPGMASAIEGKLDTVSRNVLK